VGSTPGEFNDHGLGILYSALKLHIWSQFWLGELKIVSEYAKDMGWVFTPTGEAEVNFGNTTMTIDLEEVC